MSFEADDVVVANTAAAVGDDKDAAELSGIRTDRMLLSVYTVAGVILALGSWFKVFYVMLKNMKFLRGTPLDFMAWFSSDVRKADKKALNHYKSILTKNLSEIGNGKYQDLKDFSILPDIIRGYEEVRLETMTEYYRKSDNLFKS